jgi:hypothetical protein
MISSEYVKTLCIFFASIAKIKKKQSFIKFMIASDNSDIIVWGKQWQINTTQHSEKEHYVPEMRKISYFLIRALHT